MLFPGGNRFHYLSNKWLVSPKITKKLDTFLSHFYPSMEQFFQSYSPFNRLNRRLRGKSRHVNFPLEKPTRGFFVGKADTSVFRWKSRHVDFCFKKRTRRFFVEKADTSILVEIGHNSGTSLNYYYLS